MSLPPLDPIPIGTNTKNVTTSQLKSTPIGAKNPEPTPLTRTNESSKRKGKAHTPEDLDSDPSSSDSQLRKSDSSNDSKYRKYKRK